MRIDHVGTIQSLPARTQMSLLLLATEHENNRPAFQAPVLGNEGK